jgi:hypothetical protein
MKVSIIGLLTLNLALAFLYIVQGSFMLHPKHIQYEGNKIELAMALLGPPDGVSFGKSGVFLHYKKTRCKSFDMTYHDGYVSIVYTRE